MVLVNATGGTAYITGDGKLNKAEGENLSRD